MPRRRSRSVAKHPRWKRRPQARPEEILSAALEVFGEKGFVRTRLDDVARRAGVCKGTLYLYFPSKEHLFRAMVTAKLEHVLATAEEFVRSWEGDSTELLRRFTADYWDVMNQPMYLRLARLVMSEISNFPELARWYYQEVILRLRRVIEAILTRGIAAGEFRPVPQQLAARGLQMLVVHLAQFRHLFQQYDPAPISSDEMLAGILDLYLHGVQTLPAARAVES